MTHSEGVEQGIIVPVKLLVYNVTKTYAALSARFPELGVLLNDYAMPRHDAELALATLDACERFGRKKAISFHTTNADAARFKRHADLVFEAYRPREVDVMRVSGQMHATEREAELDRFRSSDFSLVTNARLLSEGVDVPDVDLVVLATPRRSHVDILQMLGRATRTSPGKEVGYVLLPVRSLNGAVDEGDYGTAVNVLQTFLEQGVQLQHRLRAEAESRRAKKVGSPDVARVFEDRVEFVGCIDAVSLKRALSTAALLLVDPWDVNFGRLSAYKAEHGNCLVPRSFVTADGHKLGSWVARQRQMGKGVDGGLTDERAARLEALGFVWDALDAAWDENYARLEAYKAEHGDCLVPLSYVTADGYKLGLWVSRLRENRKGRGGGLTDERAARLEALGFVWDARNSAR
ncbi:helicase associated domain-containing protein [Pelagophyceae sp. CCMP2097]|nr:helicase associated domain-containing protein [Pelagophyceae sp. CCMP2097]